MYGGTIRGTAVSKDGTARSMDGAIPRMGQNIIANYPNCCEYGGENRVRVWT